MAKSGLSGLPPHRPVETALTYLPGVSRSRAKALLDRARIDPDTTTDDLSDLQVDLLRQLLRAELRDESGEIPADADNNRPWLHGAGVEFAPYLDRVRAMVQRYLVVLRPWDRSTEDPTKNPLPAGTLQTLDATCLRCLRGEALDAERTAFVGRMDARLIERYDDIAPSGEGGQRFDEMRVIFGLNDLECDLLWLLLAPELVPEFLWLYRALWRDTARSQWPQDFLQHGVDPFAVRGKAVLAALAANSTLRRYGLVLTSGEEPSQVYHRAALFACGYLLGLAVNLSDLPGVLSHEAQDTAADQPPPVDAPQTPALREALQRGFRGRRRFLVLGPERAGALRIAREALQLFGEGILDVRLDLLLQQDVARIGHVLGRARLARAGIFFEHAEVIDAGDHGSERLAQVVQMLSLETTTMFFHSQGSQRQEEKKLMPRAHLALLRELGAIELPTNAPGIDERKILWGDRLLPHMQPTETEDVVASVSVFKFGVDEIDLAVNLAAATARQRNPNVAAVRIGDIEKACRDVASSRLAGLATRVNVRGRWENTILPEETRETLDEMVRFGKFAGHVLDDQGYGRTMGYGRALTALFSGPSGTGKTLCAGRVARDLGLELFRVDLASVVSKYIGETEERLSKLFDASQDSGIALLFDEADSLFAKRTDVQSSVDRYANLEVNYLLQRLEDYEGLVILTTNNPESIDQAFMRRIRFKPNFPKPEVAERERLWRVMIPETAPREPDLKFRDLAIDYELTGGQIQNAVIRAAVWAAEKTQPINYLLLAKAGEREYKDAGRVVRVYADE